MKYLATIRATFDVEDEVEAQLVCHDLTEGAATILEEGDTIDVTQIIPYETADRVVEPAEMVEQMYRVRDMLIKTRIIQCYELAEWIDRTAWTLEHRDEQTFSLASYDYGRIHDIAARLLRPHANKQ